MTKEYIKQLCEMLLNDNLTQNGKKKLVNYINNLQQRIDLSKKLLKQYIGVLDDTADLYFENVLSILLDEEVEDNE